MGRENATACYRELGVQLKAKRESLGRTLRDISLKTGWSPTKISRVESGFVELDVVELAWYLGFIEIFHPDARPLIDLVRRAKADKGYWLSPHGEWLPDSLSSMIYHESTARISTNYEPMVIPGLLQTERYARAMISRETWRTDSDVDAAVEIRIDRQGVLGHRAAGFNFYIHEQALRLELGGPDVMHEQMIALALVGATPNADVRVVPASAGAHSYFGQEFYLFDFAQHQPLVCLSGAVATLFLEDRKYVSSYRRMEAELAAIAVSAEESREFIAALADEYDRGSHRHGIAHMEEEHL